MASIEEQTDHATFDPRFPPGTILLEDLQHGTGQGDSVILHPVPTSDPNDPLNWAAWRKWVNFAFVLLYVLLTFVQLDISFTAWAQMQTELGFSVSQLNGSTALGYAGLGVGSILFIPLMDKLGRRPLYMLSSTLQLGACVWLARTQTVVDLWLANLLAGLGGAVCETIVQVTISDVFFVHEHASMNAYYMFFTCMGAYLGPVAAGYVVESQGWRWIWWWCVILFGVQLVLIMFCFEESKYSATILDAQLAPGDAENKDAAATTGFEKTISQGMDRTLSHRFIDRDIPAKPYRERMAPVTVTDGPVFGNPLDAVRTLFTFPAISYAAITFGSILALFSILTSVQAAYMFGPPYNFSASGVGLMNVAPFVGSIPGAYIGGYLNDRCIFWLARRNGGVYEPEMRLWFMLPAAVITPASVLMLGLGLYYGISWPLLAVGFGLFGFIMAGAGSIALSYAMDCYSEVIGTAMIGIIFTRNVLAVGVLFALNPWIEAIGLRDFHIIIAVLIFVILLLPLPLLQWGKRARFRSAKAYTSMAQRQPTCRES
ncbi:hypothetical protein PWT90_07059 [Aphanocladium album]|nr:hypothetical protein PWT90_07059 [Aphanocladium album]